VNPNCTEDEDLAVKAFEHWRATRAKKCSIPSDLWDMAIDLAKKTSAFSASKVLRVNYGALQEKIRSRSEKYEFSELKPPSTLPKFNGCTLKMTKGELQVEIKFEAIAQDNLLEFILKFKDRT